MRLLTVEVDDLGPWGGCLHAGREEADHAGRSQEARPAVEDVIPEGSVKFSKHVGTKGRQTQCHTHP